MIRIKYSLNREELKKMVDNDSLWNLYDLNPDSLKFDEEYKFNYR